MATQAQIEALAVRKEIEANLRAQEAGFSDAAARERDANRRSIEAGFTSAVDQEIDANRRAREAGFLNAAVKENPAAAAPGTSIYSNAPFVDPRSPVASRIPATPTAPRLPAGGGYGAGTLNNAMPTFQGPDYYNQMFNRPLQNWSQFMPANSRLAGGGGALYQNPWGYGTGGGSGWGGSFGGGGMMGGGYPGGGFIGGGGYPGGGPFPGGSWFPGGGGGPLGPRPGSDKANDLAAGRTHHPQMYDLDDNWVGAEGGGAAEANWEGGGVGNAGATGTPWQDTMFAPLGYKMGIDFAGYNPGQGQDTGSSYEDYEDTDIGFMEDALSGPPVRTNPMTLGYPNQIGVGPVPGTNFLGPLTDPSYGDVTRQVDTFRDIAFQPGAVGTDFYGGGVTAPAGTDFFGNGQVSATPGTDFFGGGVTAPPGTDFYGGGVTAPPGTDFYGGGVTAPPGTDFFGGGVTAPPGTDFYGAGLLGYQDVMDRLDVDPESGAGAEVDVSGNGRGGWGGGRE